MELVLIYPCPFCGRNVPLAASTCPGMGTCDACRRRFPIAPADKQTVRFLKTMTDNGKALVDPSF